MPQKVTSQFRQSNGRLEETHFSGIFFRTSHVDIYGGNVFLPGWPAVDRFIFSQHNANQSKFPRTYTQSCRLTPAGPQSALCLDQRSPGQNKTTKTCNSPTTTVIGWQLGVGGVLEQSHHLEDHSVLFPLTGPEHHTIIRSNEIHRAQHIWHKCNTTERKLKDAVNQWVTLNLQPVRCTHHSPPGDTGPSWCQSAPETDRLISN